MNSTTVSFSFRTLLAVLSFFCCAAAFSQSNIQQTLSINSDGSAAHASAQLDVSATDKGMLVPRMTTAQRSAIASPATGLLVFDTNTNTFWFFNGTAWVNNAPGTSLADADGNTKIQVEESPNEDIIRFDLGGTEKMVLRQSASGTPRLELLGFQDNVFIGNDAGQNHTSGYENTAIGDNAMAAITQAARNTALGFSALTLNTTGNNNAAVGYYALSSNIDGVQNTANGFYALSENVSGDFNTAFGSQALSETTGSRNSALGGFALYQNTSGYSNVAVGYQTLYNNTTRPNLVAVGDSTLYNNGLGAVAASDATANTAIGSKALFSNTIGFQNTALGHRSLFDNTNGDNNTAAGFFSLTNNTTGGFNTAFGTNSILQNTTGSQHTAIGHSAYFTNATLSNTTCIGYASGGVINASNRIEIGNTSVSAIAGQVNFSVYSDARIKTQVQENVPGLDFILKLRPVTYHLDIHKQNDLCFKGKKDLGEWEGMYDIEQKQMTGFIAQEVEAAAKATGYDFSGVEKGADEVGLYSVKYAEFVVPLVRAVQEQQQQIEALKTENTTLYSRLTEMDKLKAESADLQQRMARLEEALPNSKGQD